MLEPNTFGTHEFMDFVGQIGAEAYVSVNVGSGTPQEAAEWLEYLTAQPETTLGKERGLNGHAAPFKVAFLGIGNESWDCGGNISLEYYLSQLKIYSRFVRNFNPAQQASGRMLKIAVGPGGDGPRWTEWTDTIMKAWQSHTWSWDFDGLSMHSYTVPKWPPSFRSVGFGETEYVQILKTTLEMEKLVTQHSAIMDKYDPEKKVALVVDEWGARYAPLPGSHPGFLVQQNSMRDAVLAALNLNVFARHADRVRMANIAQMVNVLQAMILTDKEKMVLTSRFAAVVRVLHAAEHVRPAPAFPDRRQPGRHRGHHRAAGAEHDRRDPPVAGTPETVEDGTPGRRAGPWRRDGGRVVERR